jgi:YegS/Rv2252/BmrU family lipid kinase
MEHLFIINPVAGKGKALKFIKEIKSLFVNSGKKYSIRITEKPGHATEIAREYTKKGSLRVYSVGGDGTLNEVINGMVGSNSSLAIIPTGSGNDFIKSVISSSLEPKDILMRAINGKVRLTDLAKVNEKYFINISSIGFDAEVVYNTNKIKKLPGIPGKLAYILGAIITLFKYNNNYLKVNIDGHYIETKSLLTAVANGRYYGGGMLPTPNAEIDDGQFDICLISEVNRFKIFRFLPRFIKGLHGSLKEVSFYRGKKITIECDRDLTINIDGEVNKVRKASFEIIPKGIRIVVP